MGRPAATEPQRRVELTPKQREVLALIARGRTNAEIADELGISLDGAKWHVREILGKLDVASREEAAEWWRKNGRGSVVARLARGLLAPLAVRWIGAGAAAVVVAAGALAAFAALRGAGTPADPQPTGVPVATPAAPSATAANSVQATPSVTAAATAPTLINGFQPGGLAFIRDGNLWVAAETGTPQRAQGETQVTTGGGLSYPRWSPNGRYLLVSGFGKDWLVFIKGDLTPLDDCRSPVWSPGGDMLACTDPAGDLVAIPVEPAPAPPRVLVPAPADSSRTLSPLAWAPDGRSLAYLSRGDRFSPHDLMVVDWTSLETRTMTTVVGDLLGPVWAGNYLYYQLNPSLSASILADGAEGYALDMRSGEVTDLGWRLAYPDSIAPRPKNDQVALIAGGGRQAWTAKSLQVEFVPANNSPWPGTPPGIPASPAWSADGDRIAYVSAPDPGPAVGGGDPAKAALAQRRIYIQDADGAQPARVLVDQPGYRDEHPQFDAGGSILFARIGSDDVAALWLWDAQESGLLRRMTGPIDWPAQDTGWFGYYGHISWEAVYDWYPGHHYQRGGE